MAGEYIKPYCKWVGLLYVHVQIEISQLGVYVVLHGDQPGLSPETVDWSDEW